MITVPSNFVDYIVGSHDPREREIPHIGRSPLTFGIQQPSSQLPEGGWATARIGEQIVSIGEALGLLDALSEAVPVLRQLLQQNRRYDDEEAAKAETEKRYVKVTYSPHYEGGEYGDLYNGQMEVYLPVDLCGHLGVERAFHVMTEVPPFHIIENDADWFYRKTPAGDYVSEESLEETEGGAEA